MALNKTLRLSDYTIPVELVAEPGKVLLAHGYTGAIDVVDSSLWQQLRSYPSGSDLTPDEVEILEKRGYLTTKSLEEERAYVKRFAEVLHASHRKLTKSFGFVITYDCNFRCPYCFENSISKHGTAWSKQTMTPELVDRAFEAMSEIEPHPELQSKSILLYGGEPMLRENHDIVKYIVEKGVASGFKFNVITNGYDLDYYEDILYTENFTDFQVSIDGWKDYHNRRKYHFKEGGSFDKVIKNIGLLIERGIQANIRVNTDANNFEDVKRLDAYFDEIGYSKNKCFMMYVANVEEVKGVNKTKALKYMETDEFRQNVKISSKLMYRREQAVYERFRRYFTERKRLGFTSDACSGQTGTHLFAPEGGIYSCLETVGKKEHCLGYYDRPEIVWTKARDKWFGKHVGNSENCRDCRYALFCGGNCTIKELEGQRVTQLCIRYNSIMNDAVNKAYSEYINSKKQ